MAAKRGRRRKTASSSRTGGRGMLPWYTAGLVALAGIVYYNHPMQMLPGPVADEIRAAVSPHSAHLVSAPAVVTAATPPAAVPSPTFRPQPPSAVASAASMPVPPAAIPAVSPVRPPVAVPVSAPVASPVAATALPQRFALCGSGPQRNCVIDGSTVWLNGAKIALADIDTPDPAGARCSEETRLGTQATMRLQVLLNAGSFVVTPSGRGQDDRGRQPRILMREGRSIGDQMVKEGLARRWSGHHEAWCA